MLGLIIKGGRRTAPLIAAAAWVRRKLKGLDMPVYWVYRRGPAPVPDHAKLLSDYRASEVGKQPDRFVLYRIIGNDLYPRHSRGQSRENLRFILENESPLAGCEKRFVVNRIVDSGEERKIIELLEKAGVQYIHIPFRWDEYRSISWDIAGVPVEYAPYARMYLRLQETQRASILMRVYRHKNNYVMNNNGARNAALREGRGIAKWVLPWDGNCFIAQNGWDELVRTVKEHPEIPYYVVPMARIIDNNRLLDPAYRPTTEEEPQLLFRGDAGLEFNPEYFYGRRPKVELLWRLGVPGNWDGFSVEPWDLPCPDYAEQAGSFACAGWVTRLFSGNKRLEVSRWNFARAERRRKRAEAVCAMLDGLDGHKQQINLPTPQSIDSGASRLMPATLREQLHTAALKALSRGPFSVVDKTSLPPSGDRHDYWHPAPYYWPNPIPIPGLPYIRRDGRRVPGTQLYEPLSDKYDRTRLQRLFDDTFVTALAFRVFGDSKFAEHGAQLIHRWFLNPETAMSPHLKYAQVRRGRSWNRGSGRGTIEFKDMYYFLDAVRIIEASGVLSDNERQQFRAWLSRYRVWLVESPQGRSERSAKNNHGTCYDLQLVSIALFLGDYQLLRRTLIDSRFRIVEQFDAEGRQPREMSRSMTAHYCCFNLQSWIHLAELGERAGEDLWTFAGPRGQGLQKAMLWLLRHLGNPWPYEQIDSFDHERLFPIYHAYCKRFGSPAYVNGDAVPAARVIKPLFYPHDGIQPFWQMR